MRTQKEMHANKYTHTSCMIHVQCTLCTLTRRKKDAYKNVKMKRRCYVGLEILLLVWCRLPMMERHQFEELPIHYTNVTANISLPIPFPDHPNRCHQMCDCADRRTYICFQPLTMVTGNAYFRKMR